MDMLTSLKVSISGFFVVFLALALIFTFMKVFSFIVAIFDKPKKQIDQDSSENITKAENINEDKDVVGYGELKLYGVDEKTAAMIMAIVSDESKIPLSELQFKSIKLIVSN